LTVRDQRQRLEADPKGEEALSSATTSALGGSGTGFSRSGGRGGGEGISTAATASASELVFSELVLSEFG
jgi:hypothetical protein